MALPPALRFPNRRAIAATLKTGRRRLLPLGRVVLSHTFTPRGRILFVVPLAVSKKSSERNRIKRRLDEWARIEFRALPPRRDTIVFISPDIARLSAAALRHRASETFTCLRRSDP